jgi:hypothetical protein
VAVIGLTSQPLLLQAAELLQQSLSIGLEVKKLGLMVGLIERFCHRQETIAGTRRQSRNCHRWIHYVTYLTPRFASYRNLSRHLYRTINFCGNFVTLPQADPTAQGLLGLSLRVLRATASDDFRGLFTPQFFECGDIGPLRTHRTPVPQHDYKFTRTVPAERESPKK